MLLHLHQIQGQKQNKRGGRNEAAAPVEQLALPAFCLEMRIMPPTEDRKHGAPVAAAAQPKRAADLLMEVSKGTRTRAGGVMRVGVVRMCMPDNVNRWP